MSSQVQTYDSAGNLISVTVYEPGDTVLCGNVGPTGQNCTRQTGHAGQHLVDRPTYTEWRNTGNGG